MVLPGSLQPGHRYVPFLLVVPKMMVMWPEDGQEDIFTVKSTLLEPVRNLHPHEVKFSNDIELTSDFWVRAIPSVLVRDKP